MLGGGFVQLAPEHAALDRGVRPIGVDRDPPHLRQVDHHAAVRHGVAGDVVAAAADRDLQARASREGERRGDVAYGLAANDQGRSAVDEAVVHGTGRLVVCVLRTEDGSGNLAGQFGKKRGVQGCAHQLLLE